MKFEENKKQLNIFKKLFFKEKTEQHLEDDIPKSLEFSKNNNEEELLLQATAVLFSKTYLITRKHFERPNDYNPEYLPCHLRDDIWLANILKITQNLDVELKNIIEFIRTSKFFNETRYDYEQRIIKQQIENMMYADNYLTKDDNYYKESISSSPNCDIIFRTCIVDTLTTIGIDREAIEKGIERNRAWKSILMDRAFRNRYQSLRYIIDANPEKIKLANEEHKEKWLKLRMYEYYQTHKASVDKYGIFSEKMTNEELVNLIKDLDRKNFERIMQMEETKNNGNKEGLVNNNKSNIHDKMKIYDKVYEIDKGIYLCIESRFDKELRETYEYAYITYEKGEIYFFDFAIKDSIFNKDKIGHFLHSKDYVFKFGPSPKLFDVKNIKVIIDEKEFREKLDIVMHDIFREINKERENAHKNSSYQRRRYI